MLDSRAPKLRGKFIIFCSDDWGGIRVQSVAERQKLIEAGIMMEDNRFNQYDCLESNDDLEMLFTILQKYKDCQNNPPVFTAVMNVANPDFDKIRKSHFHSYYYEPFTETLAAYPKHYRVYELYKQGITAGVFRPQFHGREHVQVTSWLKALQGNEKRSRIAFDSNFFFLTSNDLESPISGELAETFNFWDSNELEYQMDSIKSGIDLFYNLWGYKPVSFTAPSLIYSDTLNETLHGSGIKLLDVPRFRRTPKGKNTYSNRLHYFAQKNEFGQRFITRNAVFESNLVGSGIDECLVQIESAFLSCQPAIISNHRASFVGGIDQRNRNSGLQQLDSLLKSILKKWPDVQFIDVEKLDEIMTAGDAL